MNFTVLHKSAVLQVKTTKNKINKEGKKLHLTLLNLNIFLNELFIFVGNIKLRVTANPIRLIKNFD